MYKLIFSTKNKGSLVPNQNRLEDIKLLRSIDDSRIIIWARQGRTLTGYEYEARAGDWKSRWTETVFNQAGDYPSSRYPWFVTDKLVNRKEVAIILHPDGVRFYQSDQAKSSLQLLAEDGNFHQVYGWGRRPEQSLLFGNFYPDLNEIGVMSRNARGEVNFYAATKESFLEENSENPLFLLDKELSFTPKWSAASTDFFLTNLLHEEPSVIGLHTTSGLEFYQFDSDYLLKLITKTSKLPKSLKTNASPDRLFFADLTHQVYQDILHLNSSGLYVFQYKNSLKDYALLHHHIGFSQSNGWLPDYSDSVKIADINNDSRDDLIYTGPQGLTALTFDNKKSEWKILLDPLRLSGKQRYATVVGTLPPMPPAIVEPSVFTQDADGNVQWARVVTAPITTTTTPKPPTTASPVQITPPTNQLVPKQIARRKLTEKPVLRWAEQWEKDFFKDVVDTASGQVRFQLPLIDIATNSEWNFKLELLYHSQVSAIDLMGEGWSIALAQDYIQVEHRGSIYPEDAQYFLVLQGQRQLLKLIGNEKGKQRFQLAELAEKSAMTIEYDPVKQVWVIEGEGEQVIYGKANQKEARNALQWSLGWPNWRGSGRDKEQLQRLVTGWYLNARVTKSSQRVLYYDYEQDENMIAGRTYTADLRLKTVRDNQQLRLDFNYAAKAKDEYTAHNPVDDKGNVAFPVPLAHSHYLTGFSLTTVDYRQTLQFVYQIDQGKRLLTAIQQPMMAHHQEVVLQFSYQYFSEKPLLESFTSPTGATVSLSYARIKPVEQNIVLNYPIRERTKIAYGPDYAIMAYRDLDRGAGKILFRILNRKMTQIIKDCLGDVTFPCPATQSEIEDYTIQAFHNYFVVLVQAKLDRSLHFYERREQDWVSIPTIHRFGKPGLIGFSETLIAVADGSSLKLYERNAEESDWAEPVSITLSRPLTRLAIQNRLVVSYDEYQLCLFYRNSNWTEKRLASDLEGFQGVLNRFGLHTDNQKSLLQALNQNGLQILNNLIVASSLQEHNGQLTTRIHLFLLDGKYDIKERKTFQIQQENVYQLTHDQEYDGSTFKLGYVHEDNQFKLKINAISGKIVRDIEKIGNKNIRKDRMTELIKNLNESDGWKDFLRRNLLINSEQYSVRINQEGVYCGKDVFLQMTGTGWQRQSAPTAQLIPLGDHFVLEASSDRKLLKLFAQDGDKNKKGQPLSEILLYSPGLLVNRYPAYIAYQPTVDSTRVLTFKDEKTIGQLHAFSHEQLLLESDWHNLMTVVNASATTMVHSEPLELRVRPLLTIVRSDKPQLFVSQMELRDGEMRRLTGYQHTFKSDQMTYTETATVIPGGDKKISGWYEAKRSYQVGDKNVTTSEQWFDASGQPVLAPPEKQTKAPSDRHDIPNSATNPTQLFDRERKWLISDFAPFQLADESVAYYGFESYENNRIGTSTKAWKLSGTQVIGGGFSFTGNNYLQLNPNASLEGVLNPRDQTMTYLASCWLRSGAPLTLDAPSSLFKAMLSTSDGQKIIGLQSQVKRQSGDWFYLEIPIDFLLAKQIYQDYYSYTIVDKSASVVDLPSPKEVRISITLRVSADQQSVLDLDHIRFSPLVHNFQGMVYHPITGKTTDILQSNGLVTKTLYNRLQKEIAGLQEDGVLESFSTSSRTGKLVPLPAGSLANQKPVTLTFEPEQGSYETFDPYALRNRWKIDHPDAWTIAPGQLWHQKSAKSRIQANPRLFDERSAAFRCFFALQAPQAFLSLNWKGVISFQLSRALEDSATLALPNGRSIKPIPLSGELIVMLDKNYAWIWLDGVLLLDEAISTNTSVAPSNTFFLEAQGQVLIEDCLVMNRPKLRIEYQNAFSDKTQVIQMVDTKNVLVTETLYDDLGREAITSKTTRVTRGTGEPLLAYRSDFTTNKNPANPQSVWQTGKLRGEVDALNPGDQGFAYVRTEFAKSPLNKKIALGHPGPEFSVAGRYATKFSYDSDIPLLDNLFPAHRGYRQTVEHKSNGSQTVLVFNKKGNQVASYVRVPSFNHLLTTYEYDEENRLVKILPPLYHEKVGTAGNIVKWETGEPALSPQEQEWQQALATFFAYDSANNLVRKITPDTGTTEYIYNAAGQMQFMFTVVPTNQTSTITYFDYDLNGQLVKTGYIRKPPTRESVKQYLGHPILPDAEDYQQIDFSDDHPEPELRGRVKRFMTDNANNSVIEELRFNAQQQIVSKSTFSTLGPDGAEKLTEYSKQFLGSKLQTLTYPVKVDGKQFTLVYRRNRLGQLIELGTSDQPSRFARFAYNANGHLDSEENQPDTPHKFTRSYRYNSPGFLEKISDPFLTEQISYTDNGYGQPGNGDGVVMQTAFNASWSASADGRWFRLQQEDLNANFSKQCIDALQRSGYLTGNKQTVKLFLRETGTTLPLVCDKKSIAQRVAEKQIPRYYGHRYAYGNHQELVKAKYFTDESVSSVDPLQPDSFSKEIPGITLQQSQNIWKLLTEAGYVVADQQQYDPATAVGKPGVSFLRDTELLVDLKSLNDKHVVYLGSIKELVMVALSHRKELSLADFVETFLIWTSSSPTSWNHPQQKKEANRIGNMLLDRGYLPTGSSTVLKVLNRKFASVLGHYSDFVPEILRVLSQHFSHRLGSTAFDMESYKIDANGNHHLFYTGFNRYEFTYRHGTNQIQSVKSGWDSVIEPAKVFPMRHDAQGNIIQALHAGIETIDYHPMSQRTTRIILTDGRILKFHYDSQGERVLKRVLSASGQLTHETFYLRDEKGRVLVDQRVDYSLTQPDQKVVIVTAYLYGPRGLIGFIRNDSFYSVMTDHSGSIRLVIRDGQVVAAYDYLPYGGLMRTFGSNTQSQIMYRFTGQEWDEETGLYNFHARLYDPSIGRFYQPDPQSQYLSPYKYAGNSPISHIDPDGEFAFLIAFIVVGAIAGGYLGGAAANNRWNPVEWDWKDSSTYLGVGGGAIAGGLLPVGFVASVGTIGVWGTVGAGIAGSYLTTAAANNNWDPSKWQWDRPLTYNALFQGFSSGTGIVGGVGLAHNFAAKLSLINKTLFLTVSYSVAGGMTYAHGVIANDKNFAFWEWDFSSPATWSALVDGFDTGMGWPQNILEIGRGIGKLLKNPSKLGSLLGKEASKRQKLMAILKNPKHPFYKSTSSLVMVYFMGSSANNEFDITRWNLASFSTYEGVLNGIFFGKDTSNMLKFARESRTKHPPIELTPGVKNKPNSWKENFVDMLDNVQVFRRKKEYERLVENCFSTDTWRSKLLDKPDSLKGNVEEFLKLGLEQWKKGNVKPPKDFEKLLLGEAQENIQRSSRNLIEWQQESEQMSKQQRKIYPDEDAEFLSCSRGARRRKRGTGLTSGIVSVPSEKDFLENHKAMIDDGYVLIGYHGTSGEAATLIMAGNLKPSDFPDTILGTGPEKSHWNGVYVANDLEMALGYAIGAQPRVLCVYARKKDIKKTAVTHEDINSQFDFDSPAFSINREPSSSGSIVSGKESGFNLNEIIVKKGITLKTEVLPIDPKGIDNFKAFFKRQGQANDIKKELNKLPFLDEIRAGKDLNSVEISQKSKDILHAFINFDRAILASSDSIYKMFKVNTIEEADITYLKQHFFTDENYRILPLVEKFEAFESVIKFKSITASYEKSPSEKYLLEARELLKLKNLSEDGLNILKHVFRTAGDLNESAEKFKIMRDFLARENFANEIPVRTLKDMSSKQFVSDKTKIFLENFQPSDIISVQNILDIKKTLYTGVGLNNDNFQKSIKNFVISNLNQKMKINENANMALKDMPSSKDFKNAVEQLYSSRISQNSVLDFCENMKDILTSRLLTEKDLTSAVKNVLELNNDFKNRLVNQLIDIKELKNDNRIDTNVKEALGDVSRIEKGFLDKFWVDGIPLNNVLHQAFEEIKQGGGKIYYYCGARQKRSIETAQEVETVTETHPNIKSSANRNSLNFWVFGWAKKMKTNLASMGTTLRQYLSSPTICTPDSQFHSFLTPQATWEGVDQTNYQTLQTVDDYTVYHLQGGLQLVDLLIRKVTGEHYQHSVAKVDPLDEAEARLQASLQQWTGFVSCDHLSDNSH